MPNPRRGLWESLQCKRKDGPVSTASAASTAEETVSCGGGFHSISHNSNKPWLQDYENYKALQEFRLEFLAEKTVVVPPAPAATTTTTAGLVTTTNTATTTDTSEAPESGPVDVDDYYVEPDMDYPDIPLKYSMNQNDTMNHKSNGHPNSISFIKDIPSQYMSHHHGPVDVDDLGPVDVDDYLVNKDDKEEDNTSISTTSEERAELEEMRKRCQSRKSMVPPIQFVLVHKND